MTTATSQPQEGVTRFVLHHRNQRDLGCVPASMLFALNRWRTRLWDLGLLGMNGNRYEGLGFGNLSARLAGGGFVITGTQTGAARRLGEQGWCVVEGWNVQANQVQSYGPVAPSSESLTHAALYALSPVVGAVVHGHHPDIWHAQDADGTPRTHAHITYGTPQMATEMARLWQEGRFRRVHRLAMAGHEDGVVSVGVDVHAAGDAMVAWLRKAGG